MQDVLLGVSWLLRQASKEMSISWVANVCVALGVTLQLGMRISNTVRRKAGFPKIKMIELVTLLKHFLTCHLWAGETQGQCAPGWGSER